MMKISKKIASFLIDAKKSDAYWIEKLKIDFALELDKRRKAEDISGIEFAKRIGTSPAYVTKVLRGDTNLTLASMIKLARATHGKISLRIIDENVNVDARLWFGVGSVQSISAANHVLTRTGATGTVNVDSTIFTSEDKLAA